MNLKNKINKYLRKFNVEIHGLGYLQALSKNEFKNDEKNIYNAFFKENEALNIYDVGANQGITIHNFLSLFPNATIHAFEAYPPYYTILTNKFSSNPKIKINSYGISNEVGNFTFNINKSIDTSSFLNSKNTGLNSDEQVKTINQITVPTNTIDHYLEQDSNKRIHILKLDIQGSELKALIGAEQSLKEKKIDFIYTEAYFIQQYENQPLFTEIVLFLSKFGYVIQDIYHPIYGNSKLAWCDVMFIRDDLKK